MGFFEGTDGVGLDLSFMNGQAKTCLRKLKGRTWKVGGGWKRGLGRNRTNVPPVLRLKPDYGMKKTLKKLGVLLVY